MIETQRDRPQSQGHRRAPACAVLIWLCLNPTDSHTPIILESDLTDHRINITHSKAMHWFLCWHRLENSLAASVKSAGPGSPVFGARWSKWESSWLHFSEVGVMAAFLRHSSTATQLQSHQLLPLHQGANTETKGLSAKHMQHLEHQGRGAWPRLQNTNLTVQLMEVPFLSTQPRSGWTCYVQKWTEKFICTNAYCASTHQCHSPCVLSVPSSPSWGEHSTLWTLSQLCQGPAVVFRHHQGIWGIPSMPPTETRQGSPTPEKPGVHPDVRSNYCFSNTSRTWTPMFIAALYTIAKNWKQPKSMNG